MKYIFQFAHISTTETSWHSTYYFPTLLFLTNMVRLLGYNFKVGIVNNFGFPIEINRSLGLDCFILIS